MNKELRCHIFEYTNADIISLNETKINSENALNVNNYYYFDNCRKSTHVNAPTASGGVGLLVKESMVELFDVTEVDKTYTDILALRFSHKKSDFSFLVISAYLPPENSPWGRDAFSFFNHLLQLIYNNCDTDAVFILGDLNSRVGNLSDFDDLLDCIPNRCINVDDKINSHGRSLIDFLIDAKCCIANGRISQESSNKFTFHSVRGLSLVDYILVPHDNLVLCDNFNIESCTDIISKLQIQQLVSPQSRIPDHALLSMHVKLNFRALENIDGCGPTATDAGEVSCEVLPKKNRYNVKRIPPNFMNSDHICAALQAVITNIECNRESQCELDNIYDNLINVLITEMNEYLLLPESKHTGKRFKIKKPYWNPDLMNAWRVMHASERAYVHFQGSRREKVLLRAQFNADTWAFDKLLKHHKRLYDRGCLINIESLNTTNPTEFWNHVSKLGPRVKYNIPMETITDSGHIIRNKKDVLEKWVYDYENLYLNECDEYDNEFLAQCKRDLIFKESSLLDPLYDNNGELNRQIELGEIIRVLKKAKNNKSAGLDQIPYEIWKSPKLLPVIMKFFQFCLDIGKIPSEWTHAIISPIPKSNKHDKRLPLSYRGISLLNCLYKLYASFLNFRLQNHLECNGLLSDEQNGFREGRSCEDHIYVMDTVINTKISQGKQVFACFVDFSKAFDLINRDQLMLQILNKKVDGNFYWSLKSLYSQTSACLKINGELTNFFNIPNGVRQGDPLSPTLFSIYIDSLLSELKSLNLGIDINDLILTVLAYADDLVILTDSEEKMQHLLNVLTSWCKQWRLSINNTKSGVVHFRHSRSARTEYNFELAGKPVEVLTEYKYLGIILDEHLKYKSATKMLANAGGRALGGIISKFKGFKDIGYETYTKLFDNCVLPILEYGAGIWAPTNKKYPDIDNIMHRACRYYLGVHKFAPILGIMGDMGWVPNSVRRQQVVCRLWNRLIDMDDFRLTKHIFMYDLNEKGKFVLFIEQLCEDYNILSHFEEHRIIDLKDIQGKAMTDFVNNWKNDVSVKPKLRTYKEFKHSYGVEQYVKSFLPKNRRSLVAQLRLSILPLRIETGRYSNEAVESRLCQLCDKSQIEDEIHVVFHCDCYHDIRALFLQKINHDNWEIMSDTAKLQYMFENHPYVTGNFISNVMQKRKALLYTTNN